MEFQTSPSLAKWQLQAVSKGYLKCLIHSLQRICPDGVSMAYNAVSDSEVSLLGQAVAQVQTEVEFLAQWNRAGHFDDCAQQHQVSNQQLTEFMHSFKQLQMETDRAISQIIPAQNSNGGARH